MRSEEKISFLSRFIHILCDNVMSFEEDLQAASYYVRMQPAIATSNVMHF